MANKIKYGVKNVYYAKATIAANGSATYANPVAIPGAVSLSLDAEGESNTFYADNIAYFVSAANNGYTGSLEVALIPDQFRKDILGEATDTTTGMLFEMPDVQPAHFALLFQFEGDNKATKHVMYNCVASRPSVSSQTKETSINPVTETINLTCTPIYNASLDADVVKGKIEYGATGYADWFTSVKQPTAASTAT